MLFSFGELARWISSSRSKVLANLNCRIDSWWIVKKHQTIRGEFSRSESKVRQYFYIHWVKVSTNNNNNERSNLNRKTDRTIRHFRAWTSSLNGPSNSSPPTEDYIGEDFSFIISFFSTRKNAVIYCQYLRALREIFKVQSTLVLPILFLA